MLIKFQVSLRILEYRWKYFIEKIQLLLPANTCEMKYLTSPVNLIFYTYRKMFKD